MALADADIVRRLDEVSMHGWPDFTGLSRTEYHAMRLTAVRSATSDAWAIVFESVLGSFLADPAAEPFAAAMWTTGYGPHFDVGARHGELRGLGLYPGPRAERSLRIEGVVIDGPAGRLTARDAMLESLDLRPGMLTNGERSAEVPIDVLLIRAYLATFPDALWYPLPELVALLDVPEADVIVSTTAFAHVLGRQPEPYDHPPLDAIAIAPSESETYRSLASAITHRDPARFRPGESNTDWRRWVRFRDTNAES